MKPYAPATLLMASCVLAACGSEETAAPAVQPNVPIRQAAKPADPTAKMARAYVSGKQSAPVDLRYEVLGKPLPGKDLEIDLAFIATAVAESLTVTIASGTPGLDVVSNATGAYGPLKIDEIAKHKVVVRADRAEVLYFTVSATVSAVGLSSTRTFSIPLIFSGASAPAAPAAAQAKPDATGQKVESMPAK